MTAPLAGLKVVELAGGASAGFCGRQFALWGAEVSVLEPAGGGPLRRQGPFWRRDREGGSIPGEFLNLGKRRITADSPQDAAARIAAADVLICDETLIGREGAASPPRRPDLVTVVVTPLGLAEAAAGRKADALMLQAMTGYLSLNGPADGPPIAAPAHLIDHAIGVNAFVGALAALIRRRRTGEGDLVEVRGLETVASLIPYLRDQHLGRAMTREGGTLEGVRLLRCRDGHVAVAPAIPAHLPIYREVLGASPADVPDASLKGDRREVIDRIAAALAPYAAGLPVEAVFEALQSRGVVCGKVQAPAAVLADRQLAARKFFRKADLPGAADLPVAGAAAQFSAFGGEDRGLPQAPAASPHAPPLAGFTVLDLTQAWIGPFAGMILADLGAEVIKVESPTRPDIWRLLGQAPEAVGEATGPVNRSWYFNAVNRSKAGLGLDLARPEGAALFEELAAGADVVLENFTPGVMPRFGLGYERLAELNPALVMTSFSGFGAAGPYARFKANGASIEALAGWDALHCDQAGQPVTMGAYPADPICGLQMAAVTLVALYRRMATGQGGRMDGAMLEAAAEYIGDALLAEALSQAGAEVTTGDTAAQVVASGDGWAVRSPDGTQTPMRSTLEALDDPALADWFEPLAAPGLGVSKHIGRLWRFASAPLPPCRPPPRVGEHTRQVLEARLGFEPARVERLAEEKVVGWID